MSFILMLPRTFWRIFGTSDYYLQRKQKRIQNPNYLRWSFLWKYLLIIFAEISILDIWQCSELTTQNDIVVSYESVWARYLLVCSCNTSDRSVCFRCQPENYVIDWKEKNLGRKIGLDNSSYTSVWFKWKLLPLCITSR